MDGKNVAILKPSGTGKEFFNYKKYCSIVLMAVVNAGYKFIWVDIGANGAAADAQIWNTLELNFALAEDIGFQFHHQNHYHLIMSQFFSI